MVCYAVPVVVRHGVSCWVSCCESWYVMLNQWLLIMVCNVEKVIVKYGELCCVSGYELCRALLGNDDELYWASGCESWCAIRSQWFLIIVGYAEPLVGNQGVILSQSLWNMVCYAVPVVESHDVTWVWILMCFAEPSGCELWCVIPSHWL
jgi:hypothetical protein